MGIERMGGMEFAEKPAEDVDYGGQRRMERGMFGDGPGGPRGDGGADRGWSDRGVIDVPVKDLPPVLDINGPEDFEKVSLPEMQQGFEKLNQMKPYIEQGQGQNSDFWRSVDAGNNLQYADGYQKVYESFYGDSAIRVDKIGDTYDIVNGRHRIWLAQQMGLDTIPAHVIEKI